MADEYETAAVVVVFEVVIESVCHIDVVALVVVGEIAGVHEQAGDRDLPVNRRERAADRLEARELGERGDDLLVAAGVKIGECVLVERSGRIDVETVDGRVRIGGPRFALDRTVGVDDGGADIVAADIERISGMA